MKFCEIARFLNISETVAKSLGKQCVLPGQACGDEWETTFHEIERWYVGLSGKEWANLVANGQVDPIIAEVDLAREITIGELVTMLKSWEQKGIVKIISYNLENIVTPGVMITLCKEPVYSRKRIAPQKHKVVINAIYSNLKLVDKCKKILGKQPVIVTLSKRTILLSINDAMANLLQRERNNTISS